VASSRRIHRGRAAILAAELDIGGIVVRQLDLKTRLDTTATSRAGAWNTFPPENSASRSRSSSSWPGTARRKSCAAALAVIPWCAPCRELCARRDRRPLPSDTEETPVTVLLLLGPRARWPPPRTEMVASSSRSRPPWQQPAYPRFGACANPSRRTTGRCSPSSTARRSWAPSWAPTPASASHSRVEQVAGTDAPVLLLERPERQEVVARPPRRSRRRAAHVRVNARHPPAWSIPSFRARARQFTGAVAARAGWFERADGGTRFWTRWASCLAAQYACCASARRNPRAGRRQHAIKVNVACGSHNRSSTRCGGRQLPQGPLVPHQRLPIRLPPLRERRRCPHSPPTLPGTRARASAGNP